jgi:hypothetical protein
MLVPETSKLSHKVTITGTWEQHFNPKNKAMLTNSSADEENFQGRKAQSKLCRTMCILRPNPPGVLYSQRVCRPEQVEVMREADLQVVLRPVTNND